MKIPPIAIAGVAGVIALIALGSGTAKAADVKPSTKTDDGKPGPGSNPGGDPPVIANVLDAMKKGGRTVQEAVLSALGYVDATSRPEQLERFQAHYNMVSRLGGSSINTGGESFSIPSDMGGLDVTGSINDATLSAAAAALGLAGGQSYINESLLPFLNSADDEESFLIDTAWLDIVREAAADFGQGLTVEWIDNGANPDA